VAVVPLTARARSRCRRADGKLNEQR
jgi:hypothetical protein